MQELKTESWLLDTVESDEVNDSTENYEYKHNITLYLNYNTNGFYYPDLHKSFDTQRTITMIYLPADIDGISTILSKCAFIDKFKKPEIADEYFTIRIEFSSDYIVLDDLCKLVQLLSTKQLLSITNQYQDEIKWKTSLIKNEYHSYDIVILQEEILINFFRRYFPEASDIEIIRCFALNCIKYNNVVPFNPYEHHWYAIKTDKRANFINARGQFFSDTWFLDAHKFSEGFAEVKLNSDEWNYIDESGNILRTDMNFQIVGRFKDGLAIVHNKKLNCNFIDKYGKFLFDEWFLSLEHFSDGYALVKKIFPDAKLDKGNGVFANFIDKNGSLLLEKWSDFDFKTLFNGYSIVQNEFGVNVMDKNGSFILNNWYYSDISEFHDGYALVMKYIYVTHGFYVYNYIDTKGNLLLDIWRKSAHVFSDGVAAVTGSYKEKSDEYMFIDTNGNYICKDSWLEIVDDFHNGIAIVKCEDNLMHYIGKDGKDLFPNRRFKNCERFVRGIAKVENEDGKINFINNRNKLLLPSWIHKQTPVVIKDNTVFFQKTGVRIDYDGNIIVNI